MTKESIVFLAGIIIVITVYIGIPETWKEYIFVGTGTLLMIVGYSLRHKAYLRSIERENGERSTDSFVESDGYRDEALSEHNI